MLKTNVGYSIKTNSFESGVETATKAIKKLTNPKLGVVFSSVMYDQGELYKGIKSVTDIPIIGATSTGGIITPDGVIQNEKGFSGMMIFDDENLTVGIAGSEKENDDARETGRKIAREALKNAGRKDAPKYCMMFATPREEEAYMDGIQDIVGRVPIFGGSCADDAIYGDWRIILNNKNFSEGCAVVFFYTESVIEVEYTGSYNETGDVGIINEVHMNRQIMTIDNVPALKKIASWLNCDPDNLIGTNLMLESCHNPIGVKDPTGLIRLTRLPWIGCPDYSIKLGNNVAANTAVFALHASVDDLIEGSKVTIDDLTNKMGKNAKGYILFHSINRKFGVGDRLNEIYEDIKNAVGTKPFIVMFSFGEYGYREHSANYCGTGMLTYVGFGK